jgi:RNA recognition motif-containing protein
VRFVNTLSTQTALIIDGLHLFVTSEDLKEMFTPYGKVVWTRVVMDQFRRSMAYGYVVMASDAEATRAIESLNGKLTGSGVLKVLHTDIPPLPHGA